MTLNGKSPQHHGILEWHLPRLDYGCGKFKTKEEIEH